MTQLVQLRPEMGPIIVAHLQQFGELPKKGILAGQAVDSAITDIWGKGGGVYNDLDVFRQCPTLSYRPDEKASTTSMRSQLSLQRTACYGSMALVLQTTDTYGIASVSRNGMLNFVNCFMASGRYAEKLTAAQVLTGFDINCVRVAVDLATGLLHWDRHYEDFRASRQLKIAMMHTPWHTFLRLAKKARELPEVYVNLEQAAQTCSVMSRSSYVKAMLEGKDISLLFGQKNIELAGALHADWAPYFALEQVSFVRKVVNGYSRGPWEHSPLGDPVAEDLKKVALGRMVALGVVDTAVQERVDNLGKGSLFFSSRIIEESMRKKSNQVFVKFEALLAYRKTRDENAQDGYVQAHQELLGTVYVAGQALPAVSDKVEAFFKKHTKFWGLMLGMTLAEQASAIEQLKEVVQEFCQQHLGRPSEAPWGVLENKAMLSDLLCPERVRSLLVADHEASKTPFDVVPLAFPALLPMWSHYEVKELLSPGELTAEGSEMGHCVGGYSHAIRSGNNRIVQIRGGSNSSTWSTAQIQVVREKDSVSLRYDNAQHRARFNKEPHQSNRLVLLYLLDSLNAGPRAKVSAKEKVVAVYY